jgi:hypothetical protein
MINFFSHHKCATLWLESYFAKTAELNGRTFFRANLSEYLPAAADIVFFGNAAYDFVSQHGIFGCHIIRNPLNLIVSAYYSHLATHPRDVGWPSLLPQRNLLKSVDKREGMFLTLAFLERADIDSRWIGPLLALRQWDYADHRFQTLRMEDMVTRPEHFLRPLLSPLRNDGDVLLPADGEMSFENFSGGRKPGEIDNTSHYRDGSAESWKTELPPAIIQYVRTWFGDLLGRFYPESLAWIDSHFGECAKHSM